jgi:UDP:flavonoid glycosyltransferase YjiC (YdhE family)
MDSNQPAILFVCHALTGHLTPTIKIAKHLVTQQHEVYFLGPTAHQKRIASSGATFIPLQGKADYDDEMYYSTENPTPPVPDYHSRNWKERAMIDVEKQWFDPIPDQWGSFKAALKRAQEAGGGKKVVVVAEAAFHGILPMFYGADLGEGVRSPAAVVGLSVTVPLIRSRHLPPFGSSMKFDAELSRVEETERKWEAWKERTVPYKDLLNKKLVEAGVRRGFEGVLLDGSQYEGYDAFLELGVPSFFYPRTDWPKNFRFIGTIPSEGPGGLNMHETWFRDLLSSTFEGKKIVVVAQGTVETDPYQLVIPTCLAMADRPDVFVLAINKKVGAPEFWEACRETNGKRRFVDHANYDAVLSYAHVWVHNGGYGAIQHGIANAVPMVVAGEAQDKMENGRRLDYSGAGVDLRTARPTVDSLRAAIATVLDVPRYKERVEVLRKQSEELNCFGAVEKVIADLTGENEKEAAKESHVEAV